MTLNQPLLRDEERTPCEVWTRVMGYHRPLSYFNAGKQAEHRERLLFREPGSRSQAAQLKEA
ncbi:anaerobic ribonucleoside-triphosphate reductase [Allochromatium tepidum]|nr:anaerobic ribonucleoside-triphosphate reductase [Allochromatium tepidum]